MDTRTEHDLLGQRALPVDALFGIHALRAMENFDLAGRTAQPSILRAFGAVKLACVRTNRELGYLTPTVADALEKACLELMQGSLAGHLQLDALQGGAGTSTNMAVNELLANQALLILGHKPGDYHLVHPLDHVNLHQSTNDTYPTALRLASIWELRTLQENVILLLEAFQEQEKKWAHVVKVGRTQYQDAVLTTLGREMGAYADALARDRWRISKCEERLRVVNLGGTAIGTGLGAPRNFIFKAVEHLRLVSGIGMARAENLVEATQNLDALVEVSGILKALGTTLFKACSDLRLLSSGPDAGFGEIRLPPMQAGSSVMPGKVNPVIPEAVSQAVLRVFANDSLLAHAAALGSLELNAFYPLVADTLLDSLGLLSRSCHALATRCVSGIQADEARCRKHVEGATALLTALIEEIGYDAAQSVGASARDSGRSVREVVLQSGLLTPEQFEQLVSPESVMRLGSASRPASRPKGDS